MTRQVADWVRGAVLVVIGALAGWVIRGPAAPPAASVVPAPAPAPAPAAGCPTDSPAVLPNESRAVGATTGVERPSVGGDVAERKLSPQLEPAEKPRSVYGGGKVEVQFVNTCDEAVLLGWLTPEGAERKPTVMIGGSTVNLSTYEGHWFRLRRANASRTFLRDFGIVANTMVVRLCSDGSDGGIVWESRPARSKPLVLTTCATPFESVPEIPAASTASQNSVAIDFRNTCANTDVEVVWVQFDGGYRPGVPVAANSVVSYGSFVGHRWRVRDANTKRWIREFEIKPGSTAVDLCDCVGR